MSEHSGQPTHEVDPAISEAVHGIANRFGVPGLETLIALAEEQLVVARAALEELGPGPD